MRCRLLSADLLRPSVTQIKHLPWLRRQPFTSFGTCDPPFIPVPHFYPADTSLFDSPKPSFAASTPDGGPDYSSFFSSPGLSVLRPTPPRAVQEETAFWRGLTFLPDKDFFDRPADGGRDKLADLLPASPVSRVRSATLEAGAGPSGLDAFRARQRAFETPARPSSVSPQNSRGGAGPGGTPGSSGRARRMVSDLDAWREMQEHAYQAGLEARRQSSPVARRGSSGGGPTGERQVQEQERRREEEDRLSVLEERQRGVLDEIDGLADKYRDLFWLAARETRK